MSNIANIIKVVKGKDLVLLDELGTGTDPKEGEALAVQVTKYLEDKHALAMISSHFAAMKEYAFLSKKISNASMIFDEENLSPTYHFKQGVPGKSYACYIFSMLQSSRLNICCKYGNRIQLIQCSFDIIICKRIHG